MPGWSVIVWAVVTPDLNEAIQDDLREAALALEGVSAADIHVHVVISGTGFAAPTVLSWASRSPFPPTWQERRTFAATLARRRPLAAPGSSAPACGLGTS